MEGSSLDQSALTVLLHDSRKRGEVATILEEFNAQAVNGRVLSDGDRIYALQKLCALGVVPTLEPLLPGLLNLNGKPFSLRNYFVFSPMFLTMMPKTSVFCTGRQVAKSTSIAANGVVTSNAIPNFRTLFVTPLYEQIRRFSNNYVRPFINTSPVRAAWTGTTTENSVLQRTFKNLSMMLFSFALLNADRIRGVSADSVRIDETQDFDPGLLPVVREVMTASPYAIMTYTGTPKSLDNPMFSLYASSSQAEWFVPCFHCREYNIPAAEYHLLQMIGPYHDDISEQSPGTVCYKCRKPINPRFGRWVHRKPQLRWTFPGYHIPQLLLPLHYASPQKWSELLRKQQGWGNTTQAQFWNEVLGESIDAGLKLISETDLKSAAILPWKNDPREGPGKEVMEELLKYELRVLAVDWGGGGEEGVSFTTLALLGYSGNGRIDVVWGKRLLTGNDHMAEAAECLEWYQKFKCHMMAHDYTGAGALREPIIIQAGLPLERLMAVAYTRATKQDMITWAPPTLMNSRGHHNLDKTRSLLACCQAIKLKVVRFFKWDFEDEDNKGLIYDFLALVENKTPTRLAGDIYTITKNLQQLDDFAQAVNIGCSAIWHKTSSWPNFAQIAGLKLSLEAMKAATNIDQGWDDDEFLDDYGN